MAGVSTQAVNRECWQFDRDDDPPIKAPQIDISDPKQFLAELGRCSPTDRMALVSRVADYYHNMGTSADNRLFGNRESAEAIVAVLNEMPRDTTNFTAIHLVASISPNRCQLSEKAVEGLVQFGLTAKVDPQSCFRVPGEILVALFRQGAVAAETLKPLAERVFNEDAGFGSSRGLAAGILLSLDPKNLELRKVAAAALEDPYVGLNDSACGEALKIGDFARGMLSSRDVSAVRIVSDKLYANFGTGLGVGALPNPVAWFKMCVIPWLERKHSGTSEDMRKEDGRVLMYRLSTPVESSLVENSAGALAGSSDSRESTFGIDRLSRYYRSFGVSDQEIGRRLACYTSRHKE